MLRNSHFALRIAGVALAAAALNEGTARAQSQIVAWGDNLNGVCNVPALPPGATCLEVVAGGFHALAHLDDDSVVGWGQNIFGECNAPALPAGLTYAQIAAGAEHSIARASDGSIVAWGFNGYAQCNVPVLSPGISCVAVGAGGYHSFALLSDGSLIAWGLNQHGQCNVPSLPPGRIYVEAVAGYQYTVARRDDGSLVAWGDNTYAQCDVPALPVGLHYVEVAAGGNSGNGHVVARRSDGSIVAWGDNTYGQCNVPALPIGLTCVQLAAGDGHTMMRRNDGSVVAWGHNDHGQCNVPPLPNGIRYAGISTRYNFSLGLLGPQTPWTYCTAKTNSLGCIPSIGSIGTPSTSGPADDFHVTAVDVLNRKPGILIWALDPAAVPFGGGTLCLSPPIIRTPAQNSGGTPLPLLDCTGQYSFHYGHAYVQSYFLAAGQTIRAQYWSRDPGFLGTNAIGLTNALAFTLVQ